MKEARDPPRQYLYKMWPLNQNCSFKNKTSIFFLNLKKPLFSGWVYALVDGLLRCSLVIRWTLQFFWFLNMIIAKYVHSDMPGWTVMWICRKSKQSLRPVWKSAKKIAILKWSQPDEKLVRFAIYNIRFGFQKYEKTLTFQKLFQRGSCIIIQKYEHFTFFINPVPVKI